jgi:hypothetical protein
MAKKKGKGVGGPSKAELLGPASVVGFFDPPRTSVEHLIWRTGGSPGQACY